jgi:multimeric flavodoxin WrbA
MDAATRCSPVARAGIVKEGANRMQILGIVGSMRKNQHTDTLVNQVIDDMKRIDPGIVASIIHIADTTIHPCRVVCSSYCSNHPYQCSISDDATAILCQMIEADALIVGAPLYFRAPPARFQALIERLISMFFFHETQGSADDASPLKGKPCGLIAVAEYSNPHQILEYLHDFCTVLKMRPVVLERFPYLGVAGQGDVHQDTIFHPFERSRDLAGAIMRKVRR